MVKKNGKDTGNKNPRPILKIGKWISVFKVSPTKILVTCQGGEELTIEECHQGCAGIQLFTDSYVTPIQIKEKGIGWQVHKY